MQTQQKPERTCEQSLDLGTERRQQKLHRQRVLKRREKAQLGRSEAVFQSQILERALYCSEKETEEPILILDGQQSQSKGSMASYRSRDHQEAGKDNKKFISYVTMLGHNVLCHAPNFFKNEPGDGQRQQHKAHLVEQTGSRNSGRGQSQAMHSLKYIEEQIEEE